MKINIIVFIKPKQEFMPMITSWFSALRTKTLLESGCLQFEVYQHEQELVLIEEWQDQSAIDEHMIKKYTQKFIQAIDGKIEKKSIYQLKPL